MARDLAYAENRLVGGVHYRSEIVAGQRAGMLLAAKLMETKDFKQDYQAARAKPRAGLGLK